MHALRRMVGLGRTVTSQHPYPSSWTSCFELRVRRFSSGARSALSRILRDPIRSRRGRAFRLVRRRPTPHQHMPSS